MADYNVSISMSLPIPVVGIAGGPLWATLLNTCLTTIDGHDHTPGRGVPITPNALNINTDLSMLGNSLTTIESLQFSPQTSVAASGALYEIGDDLYYRDGGGTEIRMTALGGIAGTPGSIAGLVPPASATYTSGTFVWQADAGIAANMDFGSANLRNTTPNSTFALTLRPPSGLPNNYAITLPSLPATTRVLSITNTGTMAAGVANAIITADITDANITLPKMATNSVDTPQIVDNAVTIVKQGPIDTQGVAFSATIPASAGFIGVATFIITAPKADRPILFFLTGNGAGNGAVVPSGETMTVIVIRDGSTTIASTTAASPAAGGSTTFPITLTIPDTVSAGPHSYTLQASLTGGSPGSIFGVIAAIQI